MVDKIVVDMIANDKMSVAIRKVNGELTTMTTKLKGTHHGMNRTTTITRKYGDQVKKTSGSMAGLYKRSSPEAK